MHRVTHTDTHTVLCRLSGNFYCFNYCLYLHQHSFFRAIFKNYVFIFGCAGSSLLQSPSSSCREPGLLSSCDVRASHGSGFSCCRAWALGQRGFSSLGMWAEQLWLLGLRAQAQAQVHGLSCFATCGIFLDQGSNLCLLH